MVQRYLGKLSGPLLDRIDLHIEVPAVPYKELRGRDPGASSAEMRARVCAARQLQHQRGFYNAHIPPNRSASCARWMKPVSEPSKWPSAASDFPPELTTGSSRSPAPSPIWTTRESCRAKHLAEAVQYRSLDRNYWQ